MNKACDQCSNHFWSDMKRKRFCSVSCHVLWHNRNRRKIVDGDCEGCGKPNVHCISRRGKIKFCGRVCWSKSIRGIPRPWVSKRLSGLSGDKNYSWKGGRNIDKNGYVLVYAPAHPFNRRGYVYEHRLVMEKEINRILRPEEVVHHANGNPSDNRIENLFVFANNDEHIRYHRMLKPISKKTVTPV